MLNLATEADLANGSRGLIQDIVLDPRETVCDNDHDKSGIIWLQYPPAMILFKYQFDPFPGLAPGIIPIFPSEVAFNICYRNNTSMTVHRRQYLLCAVYTFTDHKVQGQMIKYVIVDIGPTKRFPVDPFTTYVALSRSRGRQSIRLLRDFDERIFPKHPSDELRDKDERLEQLTMETKNKYDMGLYDCE